VKIFIVFPSIKILEGEQGAVDWSEHALRTVRKFSPHASSAILVIEKALKMI